MAPFQNKTTHHSKSAQFYHNQGLEFAACGLIEEAVKALRQAIHLKPEFAEAYFNLGIAQTGLGQIEAAIESYHHYLRLNPDNPEAYYNLANTLLNQGDLDAAVENYRRATNLKPDYVAAFNNLGIALTAKGNIQAAVQSYECILAQKPDFAAAYLNLGALYQEMNRASDSIACYQNYIQLHPDDADAYNNLGNTLYQIGKIKEAMPCYEKALQLNPQHAEAAYNLANALMEQDEPAQALICYQKASSLRSDWAELKNNMGTALQRQGKLNDAVIYFEKALKIKPDYAEATNNLGVVYRNQGNFQAAMGCYRKALQYNPDYSEAHSNLLFCLNYNTTVPDSDIFTEASNWWRRHAESRANSFVHHNHPDPRRRLKIGYVSPDFRRHSVGFFFLPLIAAHHHDEFEIYCYAEVKQADETTAAIRTHADHWYFTIGQTDASVAQKIYADGIDILVDLAGHTANNRLLVFAHKPAPIQLTWLGYPNTTGLRTIDYRITDRIADPPEEADHLYSESLIRLPGGFLCYGPPDDAPDVCGLPARQTDRITFGSFNALPKMNTDVIAAWSEILHRITGSRLLLKCKQLADESTRQVYLDQFACRGIEADRIRMLAHTPSFREHLALYGKVDIALDPFPYNGTTTTCEALWMGVPVITLRGKRHSARVGASILSSIGLADLIAESHEAYVGKTIVLASNKDQLQELRSGMRNRIITSPIHDSKRFTNEMESTFREIWRIWASDSKKHRGSPHFVT